MAKKFHDEDEEPEEAGNDADSYIEPVQELLSQFFAPAASLATAELMLSTAELHFRIQEHAPGLVPVECLRDVLIALDYKEEHAGDGFVWLLKHRAAPMR